MKEGWLYIAQGPVGLGTRYVLLAPFVITEYFDTPDILLVSFELSSVAKISGLKKKLTQSDQIRQY